MSYNAGMDMGRPKSPRGFESQRVSVPGAKVEIQLFLKNAEKFYGKKKRPIASSEARV